MEGDVCPVPMIYIMWVGPKTSNDLTSKVFSKCPVCGPSVHVVYYIIRN